MSSNRERFQQQDAENRRLEELLNRQRADAAGTVPSVQAWCMGQFSLLGHTHSYSSLTGLPDLSVYATIVGLNAGLAVKAPISHAHAVATSGADGFMAASDKTKLDSVRRVQGIRATTSAAGVYTWTFGTPFAVGVIPVVQLTVLDATTGTVFNHKITSISNTAVTVQVDRSQATVVALLGLTILSVQAAAAVPIHLTAMEPN